MTHSRFTNVRNYSLCYCKLLSDRFIVLLTFLRTLPKAIVSAKKVFPAQPFSKKIFPIFVLHPSNVTLMIGRRKTGPLRLIAFDSKTLAKRIHIDPLFAPGPYIPFDTLKHTHTHSFNLSLSVSLSLSHTHTHLLLSAYI